MDSPVENAPLARDNLAESQEALILARPAGGSNSRALKIAGLTTLACLLLASQVFTAYTVFGQKEQIHTLQKNSEKMSRELTRPSRVAAPVRMQMPMNTLAMVKDFSLDDEDSKTTKGPLIKLQDTVVSLEKQVKGLVQDPQLPQFNDTFLANLLGLKHQMNDTEWQSFESWMRYWLIFQMAQQKPVPPTADPATLIKTKCQTEATFGTSKIGSYRPQCDELGHYRTIQCWHSTGYCWCVDENGDAVEGTEIRGRPDCQRGADLRRRIFAPRLMQQTISLDDDQ